MSRFDPSYCASATYSWDDAMRIAEWVRGEFGVKPTVGKRNPDYWVVEWTDG